MMTQQLTILHQAFADSEKAMAVVEALDQRIQKIYPTKEQTDALNGCQRLIEVAMDQIRKVQQDLAKAEVRLVGDSYRED